jgi:hypothetical protein
MQNNIKFVTEIVKYNTAVISKEMIEIRNKGVFHDLKVILKKVKST